MEKSTSFDVAIVGGGASGMFAALLLGNRMRTTVLEKNDRCCKKLSATGNGQGNLSNQNLSAASFHGSGGGEYAWSIVQSYSHSAMQKLREIGVVPQADERGRIYPRSRQASALSDLIRAECSRCGVTLSCGFDVSDVQYSQDTFILRSSDGRTIFSKAVLFAFGGAAAPSFGTDGKSYSLLKRFGHTCTPLLPSLVQLKCDVPKAFRLLKGVKCPASLKVLDGETALIESQGEILFTDYGVSGSAVFDVSGYAVQALSQQHKVWLEADFLPEYSYREALDILETLIKFRPDLNTEDFLSGYVPKQLYRALLKHLEISPKNCGELTVMQQKEICAALKSCKIRVTGSTGFAGAQVTKGGIPMQEFDGSLMSLNRPGVFACGELLDADGDCGGFNLHFAWCSAGAAADGIIKYLERRG